MPPQVGNRETRDAESGDAAGFRCHGRINDHVGAIQKFYAPDAATRENNSEPVVGRDVLAEKERRVLASMAGVETTRLGPLFLDGDRSAICWRFEFTRKDGSKRVMEEMALQTWRGEQLVEERFFYDPKQMAG